MRMVDGGKTGLLHWTLAGLAEWTKCEGRKKTRTRFRASETLSQSNM